MANEQPALVVVEMHAVAFAIAPKGAIGTLAPARPRAVAKRLEAVVPHLHEIIGIDITLVKIGSDTGTGRDGAVGQHRRHINSGMTGIKMVAHFVFVIPQKTFATIAEADAFLVAGGTDKIEHAGELFVGELQFGMLGGTAYREDGKNTPVLYAGFDKEIAQCFEVADIAFIDTGYDVPGNTRFAGQHADGVQGLGIAPGIVPQPVVRFTESVEADGDGMHSGRQQGIEPAATERHTVGNQAPGIPAAVQFAATFFEVAAKQGLTARKNNHGVIRIHLRCDFVDHPQKIAHRHIFLVGKGAAVAPAMKTR